MLGIACASCVAEVWVLGMYAGCVAEFGCWALCVDLLSLRLRVGHCVCVLCCWGWVLSKHDA